MNELRVSLFGKFCVQCDGQVLDGLDASKVQELFCYILLHRDSPHFRESLATLLWPDSTATQSRKYLRQALWQLQAALDFQAKPNHNCLLIVESNWIEFNPVVDFWLDVAVFEQAYGLVQGRPGRVLGPEDILTMQSSVDLYVGDLLQGWYQPWCLDERERFRQMHVAILDKLMDYCEAHDEYETGLVYGAQLLDHDRARERTHRKMMRLYYQAGDRTMALHQFKRCVNILAEELNVLPSDYTRTLYEQIRADQFVPSFPASLEANAAPRKLSAPLSKALEHLRRLEAALTEVQHQGEQVAQLIERAMDDRQ